MAGERWGPTENGKIRAAFIETRGEGDWLTVASRALPGRTLESIGRQWRRIRTGIDTPPTGDPGEAWQALARAEERKAERFAELTDRFRPVDLPALDRPRVRARPSSSWIISSDHHWGCEDPRAEAIILQAIEAVKPRGYVLNGDGADLLALSRYPKDARRGKSWELRDEQRAAKSWWRSVGSLMQQWGGVLYETEANHSGNEVSSRWRRWLNENASLLFTLDGFEEDCTYQRYFHHPDVPVAMVDEVVIASDLRVRHGELVRKHGGYSARAHGDKWQASVMHGHTHRIGSSIKRRPGIPGVRADEWLRTFETGCVCKLDPDYCPGGDWAQGFAVVHVDDATNDYGVELIQIINGRACSTTLGGTLAA